MEMSKENMRTCSIPFLSTHILLQYKNEP
jgi:hypothetical protein